MQDIFQMMKSTIPAKATLRVKLFIYNFNRNFGMRSQLLIFSSNG